MNLTTEELTAITELAALFYTPAEVATVIEKDIEEFEHQMKHENSEVFRAYNKGYYKSDIELRKSILESATSGSSPAQVLMRDIQRLAKISE